VFQQLAPVDEEKDADDNKTGDERQDAFPIRLAVKEVAQARARVFTRENEDSIGDQAREKKGDEDMVRAPNTSHRDGGEECGRREWSKRVEKHENRRRPFRLADLSADVTQIRVLLSVHQARRDFRDVTREDVASDSGSGHADDHSEPRVEVEPDEQNNEQDPGRRGKDRNRVDGQRREEDEQVSPHHFKIVAQCPAGSHCGSI